MDETLQLRLLGRPEISRGDTLLTGTLPGKAQAILYYLATTGQSQPRSLLASLLWGHMPETDARTNLRKAVAALRRVVGDYLDLDGNEVAFKAESSYWVDVEAFRAGVALTTVDLSRLKRAVALYRGDFLTGFYVRDALEFEDWLQAEQTRLREQAIQALQTLATYQAEQGDLVSGIESIRRLLSLEPWREEAHHQLMMFLARHGQRGAALAQFETCRRLLEEELGVEPGPETVALYEKIKAGEIKRSVDESGRPPLADLLRQAQDTPQEGSRDAASPGSGGDAPHSTDHGRPIHPPTFRHNLPSHASAFVGRERELAEIIQRLSDKDCRLLTLVGPGGIGKTRLALQVGQRLLESEAVESYQDGLLFVPLAGVSTVGGMISAIAEAVNFNFSGNLLPKQQVFGYLQHKKMLLILDNLEHLLASPSLQSTEAPQTEAAGGAELVADLLLAAPDVKILVTSREALNLQEAWFHPVKGLSFPSPSSSSALAGEAAEVGLEAYDAVRLFEQSARRALVKFSLVREQAQVVRICQLVEGMPLALELAATWLKVIPAGKIVSEIERSLDILTTRLQDIPERHRSIRAVFDYSWHLLTPEERHILAQLSVFRGSFDQEAAEKVAGASLLILATLVEKSLVRVIATGRYQMHELLRQFVSEKSAQSPAAHKQLQDQHCLYYADWLDRQDPLLRTEKQWDVVLQISANLENIQEAWRRAVEQEEAAILSRFFWSLWFVYEARSWFHAGVELFGGAATRLRSFEAVHSPEQQQVYAQLSAFHGRFLLRLHRLEQAKVEMAQSFPVLQRLEAHRDLGLALQTLGLIAWVQGHYSEARDYFEQSVAAAERGGDLLVAAYARSMAGFAAAGLGEYALAEQLIRERLPTLRRLGKLWGLVFSLAYLSSVLSALERSEEAEQLLLEGLVISREVGDRWAVADCLKRLGSLLTPMDEMKREKARQLLLESVAIFREIDDHWGLTTTLNQLGQTCCALNQYKASWQYLTEALQIAHQSGLIPIVLEGLVNLADLYLQAEASQPSSGAARLKAAELLILVINHPAGEQATRDQAVRLLAEHEAGLLAEVIDTAQTRSRALDAVVAECLAHPVI